MTIYGLFNIVKFITLVKGLKFKILKLIFHLFLIFEDGSPIGLLLNACAHVYSFITFGNQRIVSPIEKVLILWFC
jgi:hypothetical protein